MHRPSAQEFLQALLETLDDLPPDFARRFEEILKQDRRRTDRRRSVSSSRSSPVTERVQRLVMHAFRGIPGEMTVDFGKGESIVVYGDNGTGKSTIADALEWYFTGEIELLSHEGRQHAVRYVGGETDGVTSVEVVTSGTLGGKVVFPDERNAGDIPRDPPGNVPPSRTHACGLHQQDQDGEVEGPGRNPRPGRDRESSRGPAAGAKRASQAVQSRGRTKSERTVGPWLRDPRKSPTTRFSPTSSRSAGCSVSIHPQSLDQVVDPSWLTDGGWRQCARFRALRSRESAGRDQDAEHTSLRPACCRSVERPRVLRSGAAAAARLAGARGEAPFRNRVDRQGTLPALRPDGG